MKISTKLTSRIAHEVRQEPNIIKLGPVRLGARRREAANRSRTVRLRAHHAVAAGLLVSLPGSRAPQGELAQVHQLAEDGRMMPRDDGLLAAELCRLGELPGAPLAERRPALADLVQAAVDDLADLPECLCRALLHAIHSSQHDRLPFEVGDVLVSEVGQELQVLLAGL